MSNNLPEELFKEIAYKKDPRHYKYKIGWFTATGLGGFIAGVIVASIVWFTVYYIKYFF